MYILNLTYKKTLDEVEACLAEHNRYLEHYYDQGNFICSGRKEPRTGGIILCNFNTIEEVQTAIQEDPFLKQGIADYQITQFLPTRAAEPFKKIIP